MHPMGEGPATGEGEPEIESFRRALRIRRGRVLFFARCCFLAGLALAASIPSLAASLGLAGPGTTPLLLGLLLSAVASRLLLSGRIGEAATALSLFVDTLAVVHLALATGGLYSPLLATRLLLVAAAALLVPGPFVALPPLSLLAIALLQRPTGPWVLADLFLLGWYGSLDLAIALALCWLDRKTTEAEIRRRQLEAARRTEALLHERQRLSREIHDGVGAALSTLLLQAEIVARRHGEGPAAREMATIREVAQEAIDDLRRSVRMLRDDFDLRRAAEEHCLHFAARTGLAVDFAAEGEARLRSEAQVALFRVLQEALQNALRHARASRVAVRLRLRGGGCRLEVRDDGVGFVAALEPPPGHYGLRGMRERARGCGGTLRIESAPGRGTLVAFELPEAPEGPGTESEEIDPQDISRTRRVRWWSSSRFASFWSRISPPSWRPRLGSSRATPPSISSGARAAGRRPSA